MPYRFGLLDAASENLGDEIQALAARRFLPRVDRHILREALHRDPDCDGPLKVIMNGWFMHRPAAWPPSDRIIPLLISFHLTQHRSRRRFWRPAAAFSMLSEEGISWLRAHGPVGTRDTATMRLLAERGIDSYYSGCLTLTLPARPEAPRSDRVIASDLPPRLLAALAARTRQPPLAVTHTDRTTIGVEARLARAQALLDLYAGARAVVTTRLHCALPCLALGVPLLFLPMQRDRYRLQPALDLAHHCSPAEFLAGKGFDPENPPPNPDRHRALADGLIARVRRFVAAG